MDVSTKQFILLLVIQLRNECEKFPQIYPGVRYLTGGGCKVTDGYKLPSKFVLHTVVGPRDQNKQKLENCCLSCLRNVLSYGIKTVEFCCIATQSFNFNQHEATEVALNTVKVWMGSNHSNVDCVIFCTYLWNW